MQIAYRVLPCLVLCAAQIAGGCAPEDGEDAHIGSSLPPLSFEEYRASLPREADTGIYIVDNDIPVADDKQLYLLWASTHGGKELAINRINGQRDAWSSQQKLQLTYCVSQQFGARYNTVVQTMTACTGAWEAAANVNFEHVVAQDGNCNAQNNNVVFDVRPVTGQEYIARAFFPSSPRAERNVLFNDSAFELTGVSYNLTGVCTHELGHTLGFRHEHMRTEANPTPQCSEDLNYEGVTAYDQNSVMHYPQCKGNPNTALTLTAQDIAGAQLVYGPPTGTGPTVPAGSVARTQNFDLTVAQGQRVDLGPIPVVATTTFAITMSGSGDADLYVRFGSAPTETQYDCRPYRELAAEECNLDVPQGQQSAYVTVMGKAAASVRLEASWYGPNSNALPDPTTSSAQGNQPAAQQPGTTGATTMVTGGCSAGSRAAPWWSLLLLAAGLRRRRRPA